MHTCIGSDTNIHIINVKSKQCYRYENKLFFHKQKNTLELFSEYKVI